MRLLHSAVLLFACLTWSGGTTLAQPLLIEGRVEHSENLHPVDAFQVGDDFNDSLLPNSADGESNWWPVPAWLTGQWHKTGRIEVLSFTDLKTNQPIASKKVVRVEYPDTEMLGHQKDGDGQVWTYFPIPCVLRTYSGNHTNVNVYNGFDVVDKREKSVSVRLFIVTIMVDNTTRKVVSVCQRESLQTWTPAGGERVSILDSTRFFDREGVPIAAKKTQTHANKCRDYCRVNFIHRDTHRPARFQEYTLPADLKSSRYAPLDLRDSLAGFLRSRNLTSRIP